MSDRGSRRTLGAAEARAMQLGLLRRFLADWEAGKLRDRRDFAIFFHGAATAQVVLMVDPPIIPAGILTSLAEPLIEVVSTCRFIIAELEKEAPHA